MMYYEAQAALVVSEKELHVKAEKMLEEAKTEMDIENMSTKDIVFTKNMIELCRLILAENQRLVGAIDCMMDKLANMDKKLSNLENKG